MSEWIQNVGWDHRLRIQAWLYSLVVHIAMVGLMMALGTRMTLAPQDDPFRWNVAMVEPVSSTESPAQAQPSPAVEPPSKPTPPTQQIVSSKPVVQPVQRISKPVPVERHVETAEQPTIQSIEAKPHEQPVERIIQTVHATQPMEQKTEVRPSAVETPPMVAAPSERGPAAVEQPVQVAESSPAALERVTEPAQPTREVVQRAEANQRPSPAVEPVDPVVAERPTPQPIEQTTSSVMQQPVETAPVMRSHETPSVSSRATEGSTIDNQAVREERTVVAKAAPTTTPSSRADYGWVRDALWRRIVEMKHYPSQARLNHLEGKVILRAVIKSDGQLADLIVKESSGHRILDEAAMEVIRRICPVPMKHVLGKPEIVVTIPIDYRLE